MLTKTLKFDDDVLRIIRRMDWLEDGLIGVINSGQLERDLYVRVNKALEAMGGKWNRGKKGHIFKIDPRSQVGGLLDAGSLMVTKDGFFETPLSVVQRMMELVTPKGMILEPSAGLGAIVDNLGVSKSDILCIEFNEQRAIKLYEKGYKVECMDFLEFDLTGFDSIFMNPPFEDGQDIDHVRHAYDCLGKEGAMVSVMSEGSFFRSDKKAVSFRGWLNSFEDAAYDEKLPEGSFKESGTGVNTRLVAIYKR